MIGALVYSNDRIISPSAANINFLKFTEQQENQDLQRIFQLERYSSAHVLFFFASNALLLILMLFETTIFSWILSHITCFSNLQKKFETMEALSDDYLEVVSFKCLISEYERTKQERQRYLQYMESRKHQESFIIQSQALNGLIKRLKFKEQEIQGKISQLCKLIQIDEPTIAARIHQL